MIIIIIKVLSDLLRARTARNYRVIKSGIKIKLRDNKKNANIIRLQTTLKTVCGGSRMDIKTTD